MKDIYIFGASGYAKETALLIQEMKEYTIVAFVDKDIKENNFLSVNGYTYPLISEIDFYEICKNKRTNIVISIANATIKLNI